MKITDKTFLVKLVTINHEIFSGEAFFVKLTGGLGEVGFTPNHSPLLSTVEPGPVHIHTEEKVRVFHIMGGVIEVSPTSVTILADSALVLDNVNIKMIEESRNKALVLRGNTTDQSKLDAIQKEINENDAILKSIMSWQSYNK